MEDKLKDRVNKSREDWEVYDTNLESLWQNIEERLSSVDYKKRSPMLWLKLAASFLLLLGASWVVISVSQQTKSSNGYNLGELSPELEETERYYTVQISEKLNMIYAANREIDDLVLQDLSLLDSAYNDLKVDLKDDIDNQEVVRAMIENYRIKLQLLEQILKEIDKDYRDKENQYEITL